MDVLNILGISMIPEAGLRAGFSAGMALGLGQWNVFALSLIGGFLPAPFLLAVCRPVYGKLLKKLRGSKGRGGSSDRGLRKPGFIKSGDTLEFGVLKYKELFMMRCRELFLLAVVIVPFSFSGVWLAAPLSVFLKIPAGKAMALIFLGLVLSGLAAIVECSPQMFD